MNERNQVRGVAHEWQRQYGQTGHKGITEKLSALDVEVASAADVAAIMGNTSWVEPEICNECRTATWDVVQLGEESDYYSESATVYICVDCLRKALALVGDAGENR